MPAFRIASAASGGWVTDPASDQPDGVALVVWAVPDTPAAGDLVLPLLEGPSTHAPGGQLVSQPALALVPAPRVGAKLFPAGFGRPRCVSA
jgi:hypothetical protein